jgi:hypothetical protein
MLCISELSVEMMETLIVKLTVVRSLQHNIHAFASNIVKLSYSKNAFLQFSYFFFLYV